MNHFDSQHIIDKFFQHSIDLLCVAGMDGRFIKINPMWEKTLGYKTADLEGKQYLDFVHPDDVEQTIEAAKTLSNNSEVIDFENRYRHKNGTYLWLQWRSFPHEGKIYATVRNVTEEHKIQEENKKSEAILRSTIESTEDGILIVSAEGNIIHYNSRFQEIFEIPSDVITTHNATLLLDFVKLQFPQPETFSKTAQDIFTSEASTKDYFKLKNGIILKQVSYPLIKESPVEGRVWIFSDVTQQKQAEIKARENDRLYKSLFQNLTSSSSLYKVILDKEGNPVDYKFIGVNSAYEQLVGKASDDLIGKTLLEVYPKTEQVWLDTIKKAYLSEETITIENYSQEANMYFEIVIYRPQEGLVAMIGKDITKQRLHEIELKKAKDKAEESDNLKTAFLANLSHEIRTPMNGILGFANLLKEQNLTPATINLYIDLIEQSGERMLKLINDLVNISKIESNQITLDNTETNLNILIDEIVSFFLPQTNHKNIILNCEKGLSDAESIIKIDKLKLEQILSNLINNAIKFTKKGTIKLTYILEGKHLLFKVKDSGFGIAPNLKDTIFERFRQGEDSYLKEIEGSGLGLSISKSFIEMMGGEIWFESEYGKGSEFFIKLPYNPAFEIIEHHTHKKEENIKSKTNVLIAEDEQINYFLLEQILSKRNFSVMHAEDGEQAVSMFNQHPEIELILMDLKMPVMNGIDATKQIKEINPDIPIIVQTGYASSTDEEQAFEAGCSDFITKPVNIDELLVKIKKVLIK